MALPSFPTFNARDAVLVMDENYNQVFPDAKIIDVLVKEESKLMDHPVEDSKTITDHGIILPIEIEMKIYIPPHSLKNTYNIIKSLLEKFTPLTIQTYSASYKNQVISSMPHSENSEVFQATIMTLKTHEVQFVQPQYSDAPISPKNPNNASTNDRGVQDGSATTPPLESEWKRQNRLAQR